MSLIPVAPLKLARFPLSLVATSRLYLLCRLPQPLHSLRDSLTRPPRRIRPGRRSGSALGENGNFGFAADIHLRRTATAKITRKIILQFYMDVYPYRANM